MKGRKSTERFPTFSVIFSHPHTQFSNQKYIAVYEAKEQIQCPYINLTYCATSNRLCENL